MPYIKKDEVPFVEMQRLLRGYELTAPALAKVLGCSEGTARSRLKSPADLTLGELDRLARFGHIPMEKIRAAIVR